MKRIYSLDYLRGLAAFSIMIFHFFSWTFGEYESNTLLGKFGIYGVSIFYILSGLTLFHVNKETLELKFKSILIFFKKRVIRIFPLLWLVTITSVILFHRHPNLTDLFPNLTGLFGFFRWDKYFSAGIWSIGNELTFYVFFPIFIFLSRYKRIAFIIFSLILFSIYIYFSFYLLDSNKTLAEQWYTYINPLNQVFLFLIGFVIGYLTINKNFSNKLSLAFIISGSLLFYIYPSSGDAINLVTGWTRLFLSFSCIIICLGFYKISFDFPSLIHKPLVLLGEISYSLYLLHPLVYSCFFVIQQKLNLDYIVLPSIIITFVSAYLVYTYYEKFFTKKFR